jgi:hypothetical protein
MWVAFCTRLGKGIVMRGRDQSSSEEPSLREIVDRATGAVAQEPEPARRSRRYRPSRALRTAIGLAMFAGGLAGVCYALVRLMHIGTCASGNTPYAIARQCPSGTGAVTGVLVGSIFLALIGAAIAAVGLAISMGVAFTAVGAAALYGGLTAPGSAQGASAAGYSVGIPFIVIGLGMLAFGLWWRLSDRGDTTPTVTAAGLAQLIAATAPKPITEKLSKPENPTEGG